MQWVDQLTLLTPRVITFCRVGGGVWGVEERRGERKRGEEERGKRERKQ